MDHTLELASLLARHGFRRHPLIRNRAGHFQTVAQLNRESINLLIDTGASGTVVDLAYCRGRNLALRESGRTGGGVGGQALPIFELEEPALTLDEAPLRCDRLVALDLSQVNRALSAKGAEPIQAVAGADVLQRHQAVIDYANQALFLKHCLG